MAHQRKNKLVTQTIYLDALNKAVKQHLAEQLFPLHSQIFEGVSFAEFKKYVIENNSNYNELQLYFVDRKIVGYCAMHRFDIVVDQKKIHVFRMESGMLHEYRGLTLQQSFIMKFVLKYLIRHPFSSCLYLGTLVHPSSYCVFHNAVSNIYPNDRVDAPDRIKKLISVIREKFNLDQPFPDNDWITNVGWITRDTEAEKKYWANTNKKSAVFYRKMNPEFSKGFGLITLFEVNISMMLITLKNKIRKKLTSLLYKLANLSPAFAAKICKRKIRQQLESLGLMNNSSLSEILVKSPPIFVPQRNSLFQNGKHTDGIYILLSGSAYVLIKGNEGNIIVDEIVEKNLIVEIAGLEESRNATTIKTITNSIFLKIEQPYIHHVLPQLMLKNPSLFKHLGLRLLEIYLNFMYSPKFWTKLPEHDPKTQLIYVAKQQTYKLNNIHQLFVFFGFVKITSAQDAVFCRGQSIARTSSNDTIVAIEDACLLILEADYTETFSNCIAE